MLDYRVLKVVDVADKVAENRTVTLAPQEIRLVIVMNEEPVVIRDQEYRNVQVVFTDGDHFEMTLSEFDINQLETLVGGYGVPLD
jgi:hypothetical protein